VEKEIPLMITPNHWQHITAARLAEEKTGAFSAQ
jgi:hypothetical protein